MTAMEYFAKTETVRIATDPQGEGEIVTPIWAVVVNEVPYIRSGFGPDSHWYRRAQSTGRAEFVDGSRRHAVTLENVVDDVINDKVDAAYRVKYAGSQWLPDLVTQQARGLTMRIALS